MSAMQNIGMIKIILTFSRDDNKKIHATVHKYEFFKYDFLSDETNYYKDIEKYLNDSDNYSIVDSFRYMQHNEYDIDVLAKVYYNEDGCYFFDVLKYKYIK